ncbi:MAG: VanZ family protein [Deltaproteobacteria bacterium]|nr:VanZ family protein [Deltaproteobacteria bacterium]
MSPEPRPRGYRAALAFLPALAFAALVFYLSSLENPLPDLTSRLSDKLLHAAEYGTLGALLAWPLARVAPRRAFLLAVVLASLYGASDELHQGLVPGREASARDWVADTAGGALGAAAALWLRRRRAGEGPPRGET